MSDHDTILERVRALLAKAEGASTEAEADAYNAKAEMFLQKYGIDRALAEAREEVRTTPVTREFKLNGQYGPAQARLWNAIAKTNRCLAIRISGYSYDDFGNRARTYVTKVVGYSQDVEIVEMLYTSLHLQVSARLRHVEGGFGIATKTARNSYFNGFIRAVHTRLAREESDARTVAEVESTGTELVLADRAAIVAQTYADAFPDSHKLYARAAHSDSHYRAGKAFGEQANLHNRPEAPALSRQVLS